MPIHLEVKGRKFHNCTFITGFHGIGETGYIAVSYLVHALKSKRIGFIEVSRPPPFITTYENGIVTPFEVYRKNNIVLAKFEFSPHRSEESEFVKELAKWVVKERFKDAILIGGLDESFRMGNGDMRIVPTKAYLPKVKYFDSPLLESGLFVYGPLAIMLSEFEMRNFPAMAILPYASPNRADPRAAAIAIKKISKVYMLNVDTSELEKDAEEIENEVDKRVKQAEKSFRSMYM
ncbi:MAG: PAC2 family protein [Candidatus Bathyarchaeia archaeon]